ncbi:MAG: N-acetylmuramoyl-L-alanine amidase [Candidatus Sumerlaeaceae bacterium]
MKLFSRAAVAASFAVLSFPAFAATPDLPSCDSWQPAATCNYSNSSRPGSAAINYVIIHKVQGTAAGAASWFQNCASGVSAHFSFNNSTGYCYQSVLEEDIGWHCINRNTYGVGIEHGGYVSSNDTATVCYDESALETKSCIIYYTVLYDRAHIQGHSEVPGNDHTDPGVYWNWTYYMSKCNPNPNTPVTIVNDSPAGSTSWITATSAADKYGADYKYRSTAAISDAATWTNNIANGGTYTISAWWSQGANRSASAPYILPNGGTVSQNQQASGGVWNALGTIGLSAGTNVTKLSCWTTTGYVVIADAVKYYGPQ